MEQSKPIEYPGMKLPEGRRDDECPTPEEAQGFLTELEEIDDAERRAQTHHNILGDVEDNQH